MMKSYLLGIDIGTSACKVAVFDKEGKVLAAANGDYPVYYPQEGWAEQNPEEWWSAVCRATKETVQKAGIAPAEIAGVGIDGQSWSAIALDKEGKVLTNTPIWMDTRAQDICERLNKEIGEDKIFEVAGNSLQPSYTTAKIIWYKENLPEVYEKIDKTIDREVVEQYIQHPKIAKDFANYLELFYKYRTDYQIEEIFKGNPDEILMKKVSHASFDERLAVLGLLISKVNERIRFAVEKEEEMELLQGTLIRYKESGQAEVSKDALELLEEVTAGLLFEEKQKKEAELLSRRQEQNYRRAGTLLETYLQRLRLEGSMDFETAFAKIKEWFEEENQKYLQMGQTAEQYLEYAFDFLEGTGLTGQEMVIFITELNSNARSVAFLQECESERYFRYNKELLFSEKREKILEKLN